MWRSPSRGGANACHAARAWCEGPPLARCSLPLSLPAAASCSAPARGRSTWSRGRMTAARVASPEGWQVSVRLVGGSWGASWGRVVWCWAVLVVGTLVVEGSLVDGLVVGVGWWGGLVGGRFGGGCAGGGVGGSDESGGLMVGWCWRAGRGRDWWWRGWWWWVLMVRGW